MKLRTAVLTGLLGSALAAGAAQAATLTADRACYAPGDAVGLSGAGFTPSGEVALSVEGRQLGTGTADPTGAFQVALSAPSIDETERTDTFTATDQTNLAITATVGVRLTSFDVTVKPKNGNPGRKRRIKARGFTAGKVLYAHVRKGKVKRNVKIGKLKGACKTLSAKKRIFSSKAKSGVYKVQFDTKRKYSAKTIPQVAFFVTIFRTFKPASASLSSLGERWVRVR